MRVSKLGLTQKASFSVNVERLFWLMHGDPCSHHQATLIRLSIYQSLKKVSEYTPSKRSSSQKHSHLEWLNSGQPEHYPSYAQKRAGKPADKWWNAESQDTFFRNVATVSRFAAVMRFTPSGDWTRIICGELKGVFGHTTKQYYVLSWFRFWAIDVPHFWRHETKQVSSQPLTLTTPFSHYWSHS